MASGGRRLVLGRCADSRTQCHRLHLVQVVRSQQQRDVAAPGRSLDLPADRRRGRTPPSAGDLRGRSVDGRTQRPPLDETFRPRHVRLDVVGEQVAQRLRLVAIGVVAVNQRDADSRPPPATRMSGSVVARHPQRR